MNALGAPWVVSWALCDSLSPRFHCVLIDCTLVLLMLIVLCSSKNMRVRFDRSSHCNELCILRLVRLRGLRSWKSASHLSLSTAQRLLQVMIKALRARPAVTMLTVHCRLSVSRPVRICRRMCRLPERLNIAIFLKTNCRNISDRNQ